MLCPVSRADPSMSDGRTQFYHTDDLGSASVITDSNGNRKEQMVYFPFGTYRAVGNINGTYDYDPSFPDVFYTFTDQEDDDDLGFYNYEARLYDPVLGRFISPDSMVPDPNNPQSLNRYSYALNNPLRYIDPSGNQYDEYDASWGDIWGGSIYDTWGSSWNLSFNLGSPITSSSSNYSYQNVTSSITSSYSNLEATALSNWSSDQSIARQYIDQQVAQTLSMCKGQDPNMQNLDFVGAMMCTGGTLLTRLNCCGIKVHRGDVVD